MDVSDNDLHIIQIVRNVLGQYEQCYRIAISTSSADSVAGKGSPAAWNSKNRKLQFKIVHKNLVQSTS